MHREPFARREDITKILLVAAQLVAEGHTADAARTAMTYAHSLQEQGFSQNALDLLVQLEQIVPFATLSFELQAEFLVLRGLAETWQGQLDDARRSFTAASALIASDKPSKLWAESVRGLGLLDHFSGRFDRAREQYETALSIATEADDPVTAFKLKSDLLSLALESGQIDQAEELLSQLDAQPVPAISIPAKLMLLAVRGELSKERRQYTEAESYFRRVLRAARRNKQLAIEVRAMRAIGDLRLRQERPGTAVRWFRNALKQITHLGVFPEEVGIRLSFAVALFRLERVQETAEQLEIARALASEVGDTPGLVRATAFLGDVLQQLNQLERAGELLAEASRIALELGIQPLVTHVLRSRAEYQRATGYIEDSLQTVEIALQTLPAEEVDERINLLRLSGEMRLYSGDSEGAAALYSQALSSARQLGDETRVFFEAISAAISLSAVGSWNSSIAFFNQALTSAEILDSAQMVFQTRSARGASLAAIGEFASAQGDFEFMLEMADENQDRAMAAISYLNLGILERQKGDSESATVTLERGLLLARELENELLESRILIQLAESYLESEKWSESEPYFRQVGIKAEDLGLSEIEMRAAVGLGRLAFASQHFDDAINFYGRAVSLAIEHASAYDLGSYLTGLIASHLSGNNQNRLTAQLRRIVEVARQANTGPTATLAFMSVGNWALERGLTQEASLAYAMSFLLAVDGPQHDLETILNIFQEFVDATRERADQTLSGGSSSLYRTVVGLIESENPGIGKGLRNHFTI